MRAEIITATTTPFGADGSVDLDRARDQLRRLDPYVDGAFVCGTTGEFPALDPEERTALIRTAVEELGPDRVIAHVGAPSARQAVALALAARDAGATRFAAVTPYYLAASTEAVADYYAELRRALPDSTLYAYLFPDVAVTDVAPDALPALIDAGIDGVKVSGAASTRVPEYLAHAPRGFALWSGNDADLPAVLAAGGRGTVSGVSGVAPEPFAAYRDALAADDGSAAELALARIVELVTVLGPSIARLKTALDVLGLGGGPVRMSIDPIEPALAERIRTLVT